MTDVTTKIKNDLVIELSAQYRNLIAFINSVPVSEQFKQFAFLNLDQGIFWIQKGIELIKIPESTLQSEVKKEETAECAPSSCS